MVGPGQIPYQCTGSQQLIEVTKENYDEMNQVKQSEHPDELQRKYPVKIFGHLFTIQ